MRETIGIRTLNNSIDLNNLYLTEGSVSYAVDGNTLNNYPTIDRGILTVNKTSNNILQIYTTKKRIYKRYGTVELRTVYEYDKVNGTETPVTTEIAVFGPWYYEIYGKDTATMTDYGLVTESRLKYLVDTYAPTYDATDIWNITNTKGNSVDLSNRVLKSGDTLTGDHVFTSGLETIAGNVHMMSADIGFYRLAANSAYWVHLMHMDGGATLIVGGDEAESLDIMQWTSNRPWVASAQSGDVAYVEDLDWKMVYQGFSGRQGTIPLSDYIPGHAVEVMLRFYTPYEGVNYISAYNCFPVHTGIANWSLYHYGVAHIRVNHDTLMITNDPGGNGIYPRGDYARQGSFEPRRYPIAYLFEVNWR